MAEDRLPKEMVREGLTLAAMVFLHREASKAGEIRLSEADVRAFETSGGDAVKFDFDESTGDILLRHVKSASDA